MNGVSVVVPTYNRADILSQTLQSISRQTVRPFEVIVVDDGSTDNTAEVCSHFGESVRYIAQENRGLSAARNTGIRAATGDWVAFCDSDDLWLADKLELQLAALEASGAGWSATDFSLIGPDGEPVTDGKRGFARSFAVFRETKVSPEEHLGEWLQRRELRIGAESVPTYSGDAFGMLFLGNVVLPSTSIVARNVIDQVGLFDESFRVAEETEFFHRVAARSILTVVMKPLCKYRVGHPSIIAGNAEPLVTNAIRSLDRAVSLRPELTPKESGAVRKGRQRLRTRLAYARLSAQDRRGARQAVAENFHDQPFAALSTAIFLLSLLPNSALRGLHWAKSTLRGSRR